jgi:hypothetical protein
MCISSSTCSGGTCHYTDTTCSGSICIDATHKRTLSDCVAPTGCAYTDTDCAATGKVCSGGNCVSGVQCYRSGTPYPLNYRWCNAASYSSSINSEVCQADGTWQTSNCPDAAGSNAACNNVACTAGTSGSCSIIPANGGLTCQAASCAGTQYIPTKYCDNGNCVSLYSATECNYNADTATTWLTTKCSCVSSACQSVAGGYQWSGNSSDCYRERADCLNVCNGNNYLSCIDSSGACCSGCQPPTYSYDYACPWAFGTIGAYSQY